MANCSVPFRHELVDPENPTFVVAAASAGFIYSMVGTTALVNGPEGKSNYLAAQASIHNDKHELSVLHSVNMQVSGDPSVTAYINDQQHQYRSNLTAAEHVHSPGLMVELSTYAGCAVIGALLLTGLATALSRFSRSHFHPHQNKVAQSDMSRTPVS